MNIFLFVINSQLKWCGNCNKYCTVIDCTKQKNENKEQQQNFRLADFSSVGRYFLANHKWIELNGEQQMQNFT
jgi:thiol-disulfide isomerase/thioredoxin